MPTCNSDIFQSLLYRWCEKEAEFKSLPPEKRAFSKHPLVDVKRSSIEWRFAGPYDVRFPPFQEVSNRLDRSHSEPWKLLNSLETNEFSVACIMETIGNSLWLELQAEWRKKIHQFATDLRSRKIPRKNPSKIQDFANLSTGVALAIYPSIGTFGLLGMRGRGPAVQAEQAQDSLRQGTRIYACLEFPSEKFTLHPPTPGGVMAFAMEYAFRQWPLDPGTYPSRGKVGRRAKPGESVIRTSGYFPPNSRPHCDIIGAFWGALFKQPGYFDGAAPGKKSVTRSGKTPAQAVAENLRRYKGTRFIGW